MNKYTILSNISCNFNKLLIHCTDAVIFNPPIFTTSDDIDTLILLNQIIDLISKKELEVSIQNDIINDILEKIIEIKLYEFCQIALSKNINNNFENFKNSFCNYIKTCVQNRIDNYKSMMR